MTLLNVLGIITGSFLCLILILVLFFTLNGIYCSMHISVSNYKIETNKIKNNYRLVLIADLHNKVFGNNNDVLIQKIKEQNPDFVIAAGDIVFKKEKNTDIAKDLLCSISEFAPVYYGMGNHEKEIRYIANINDEDEMNSVDMKYVFKGTNVKYMENETERFYKNSDEYILIGAINGQPVYKNETEFFNRFKEESKGNFSILIIHQPEHVIQHLSNDDLELVLSGHTHGGQFRIPFVGGLICPNQGFFPKYDKGLFTKGETNLVITSGLGNSHKLPRINNPAEIVVIDIVPKHTKK